MPLTKGYKVAVMTLLVELVLALGLFSDSTGIFAILAMVLVAIAWLPAGWMIWMDARSDDEGASPFAYVIAGACALAGGLCLLTFGKWMLLSFAVMQG